MSKRWNRKSVLTVPNLMSLIRLALIPLYLWLYCAKGLYGWSVGVLVISGVTDIFDGRIARQFNQVSDVGKVLDPLADKLTQAALIVSLAGRYRQIWLLFILFAVKEIAMALAGVAVLVKTDTINSAQWFGKAASLVLEVSMGVLILFPGIPVAAANVLLTICAAFLVGALVGYMVYYVRLLREHARARAGQTKSPAAEEGKG